MELIRGEACFTSVSIASISFSVAHHHPGLEFGADRDENRVRHAVNRPDMVDRVDSAAACEDIPARSC
jgi:hypothetical protein